MNDKTACVNKEQPPKHFQENAYSNSASAIHFVDGNMSMIRQQEDRWLLWIVGNAVRDNEPKECCI